jgi:integrase
MPRRTQPLSDREIRSARFEGKPRKLFDGEGLFLLVGEHGKYWRLKYRFDGKERNISLGQYPDVTLAAAREKRHGERQRLAQGIDPSAHRRAEKASRAIAAADTFEAVAREWVDQVHCHRVVSTHSQRNLRRLENHVFPGIGRDPIASITAARLLEVLRRLERAGSVETAHRVRTLCSQIFRYAVMTARAERDVAADLRGALKTVETQHYAALTDPKELGALLRAIQGHKGQPATVAALQLAPILFARPGELRTAKWEMFDLAGGVWNYEPSKGGVPMVTSLPRQATEILQELHGITGPDGYVFPSMRGGGRPLSENTLNAALRSLGYEGMMTAHGFRAAARTILVEMLDQKEEWVEMQLGHAVRDPLGRAYNRTTYLEQRREMLQVWADYLVRLRAGL